MAQFQKHYTLKEARDTLPWLRAQFAQIHHLLEALQEEDINIQQHEIMLYKNGNTPEPIPSKDTRSRTEELKRLIEEIMARSILIKDLNTGLIDFPHWREGEEVLLCWQSGEEDISFWHNLEDGFAGRQPL